MSKKCKVCVKSVYPNDPQINLDGCLVHTPCAKCEDCRCQITLSNFCKNESGETFVLLCKTHYFKRFHEGGSYLGGDKFQVKNPRDVQSGEIEVKKAAAVSEEPTVFKSVKDMVGETKRRQSISQSKKAIDKASVDELVEEIKSRGYTITVEKIEEVASTSVDEPGHAVTSSSVIVEAPVETPVETPVEVPVVEPLEEESV